MEYLPALSAQARALLIRRQAKVFKRGGMVLAFHTFCKMEFACGEMLLVPCVGRVWV
jgi:hypothetical protein